MDFSYELAPRAKIFRRDQGKVINLESMKYIMRYNSKTCLCTVELILIKQCYFYFLDYSGKLQPRIQIRVVLP